MLIMQPDRPPNTGRPHILHTGPQGHCLGHGLPGAAGHLVEGITRDSVLVIRPLGGSFSANRSRAEVSTSGFPQAVLAAPRERACSVGRGWSGRERTPPGPPPGAVLPCPSCLGLGEGAQASPGLVTPCMWTWSHAALRSQLTSTSNHRAPSPACRGETRTTPALPFFENLHESSRKQPWWSVPDRKAGGP